MFETAPDARAPFFASNATASAMPHSATDFLAMPDSRRVAIDGIARELTPGRRVALSTHMNSDGDGCGSEAALARMLAQRGLDVRIVNPTPWPDLFNFLLGDDVRDESPKGAAALRNINKVFTLFNVHANNCRPLGFVGGFAVADTLELSFVKTELIVRKPSQTIYPDQQDMANNHAVSDHPLLFFPFLPSSVPLDEVRERMKKIAAEKSQSAFA